MLLTRLCFRCGLSNLASRALVRADVGFCGFGVVQLALGKDETEGCDIMSYHDIVSARLRYCNDIVLAHVQTWQMLGLK